MNIFIPLRTLVSEGLPTREGYEELVRSFEEAKKDWQGLSNPPELLGGTPLRTGEHPMGGALRYPTAKLTNAYVKASARRALGMAIKYYAMHGKVAQAYTELRELAAKHWHPAIFKFWPLEFARRAKERRITINAELRARIDADVKSEIGPIRPGFLSRVARDIKGRSPSRRTKIRRT